MHNAQYEAFDYPHPVGLIELYEGVRLVAPISDAKLEELEIGIAMEVVIESVPGQHNLPRFRPAKKA